MLLNVVRSQVQKSLQKRITKKSVRASKPLSFIDYMVLLVMLSMFLDIVQNARDWNEKLNRASKYMNQWLVQVFVCLFGWLCVCFEATGFFLPRSPPCFVLQYTFTVLDV